MHQLDFPFNFYQSLWSIPIQNNMHCWWTEIKERPKYKIYDNIEDLSKTTFWYHSNDTKRNPWVMLCSHCQINDSSSCLHITVYLEVTLQAIWHTAEGNYEWKGSYSKSWWIAKLCNINFAYYRSKGLPELGHSNRNLSFPH